MKGYHTHAPAAENHESRDYSLVTTGNAIQTKLLSEK